MIVNLRFDGREIENNWEDFYPSSPCFDFKDIAKTLGEHILIDKSPESVVQAVRDIRSIESKAFEKNRQRFKGVWCREAETPMIICHLIPDDVDEFDPYLTRKALKIGPKNELFSAAEAIAIILYDAMHRAIKLIEHDNWMEAGEIGAMVNRWFYGYVNAERRSKEEFSEQVIKKYKSKEASRIALIKHEKTTYRIKEKTLALADQEKVKHPKWSTRKIAFEIFDKVHAFAEKESIPFMCSGPTERPFYQDWLLPHFREEPKP